MSPADPILKLDAVTRQLGGRDVVRALDLGIARGEVLGLLGVNGAGKSTTLRMMAGVLAPTSGHVRLDGADLYESPELGRRRIGYLPEQAPLHDELTVVEFLRFCGRLRGLSAGATATAVDAALARCELGEVRRRLIGALSKGFRQRVGVAQAILHDPDVVVLDEPASGLDPVQTVRLRETIRALAAEHAVVLSTHVLSDVIACCDRVAILHDGRLRHQGAVAGLGASRGLRVAVGKPLRVDDWRSLPGVESAADLGAGRWRVELAEGTEPSALASALVARGWGLRELTPDGDALEATFLRIATTEPDALEAAA